jgi:hypothetical protein
LTCVSGTHMGSIWATLVSTCSNPKWLASSYGTTT